MFSKGPYTDLFDPYPYDSGYLPAASTFAITPGLEDTPVLHCHGQDDAVVSHTYNIPELCLAAC